MVNKGVRETNKEDIALNSCGLSEHQVGDPKCPVRDQTSRRCKGKDHFASVQEESQTNRDQVD